jgi:hypothetical protein
MSRGGGDRSPKDGWYFPGTGHVQDTWSVTVRRRRARRTAMPTAFNVKAELVALGDRYWPVEKVRDNQGAW